MLTEQEKQIPKNLLDQKFMVDFLNERLKDIDSQAEKVEKVEVYPVKQSVRKNRFHLVVIYEVILNLNNNEKKKQKIVAIAHSNHQRRQAYNILKLVYENGFAAGNTLVPRPLWYIEDLQTMFYIGVEGENLFSKIKHNFDENIEKYIQLTAKFLAKFHQLSVPKELELKKYFFSWHYLDPAEILKKQDYDQEEIDDIKIIEKLYQQLKKKEEKLITDQNFELSHGDLHLENVMVSDTWNRISMIDFSEACLAPAAYDLGSFLQQLKFMSRGNPQIKKGQRQKWQDMFLTEYFSQRKLNLDENFLKVINLYQTWTALRSAVFYIGFREKRRKDRTKLLIQVENFLKEL